MLPASMLFDFKHPAYALNVMVMYLACDTFMERYLTTLDSLFFFKLMPEIKVTVATRLYMYSTPWPQDVSTNQIWDSYVK